MIKTIIFDFGGVLGTDADTVFIDVLSKHGIAKKKAEQMWEKHWSKLKCGEESVDLFWRVVHSKTSLNIDKLKIEYASRIEINQELVELCLKLKKKGYKLGILANETKEWMEIKIKKGKLSKIFDAVYSSADIKLSKPDIKAYKFILDALNASPEETLFIDNLERNTDAAEKLGMKAIVFENIDKLRRDLKKFSIVV